MLKEKLHSLGQSYFIVEMPGQVFNCLEMLESNDVIIINNPKEFNQLILQINSQTHFYLGFNDASEIESNGIIPVNRHEGVNAIGLSAKTIAIFKDLEQVNLFIKEWFHNSDIHFFKMEL